MEGSIYDCINHDKYVNKKNPTFGYFLVSMSKLATSEKLRKLLSGIIVNQSLELSNNVYKIKGIIMWKYFTRNIWKRDSQDQRNANDAGKNSR